MDAVETEWTKPANEARSKLLIIGALVAFQVVASVLVVRTYPMPAVKLATAQVNPAADVSMKYNEMTADTYSGGTTFVFAEAVDGDIDDGNIRVVRNNIATIGG